MVELFLVLPFDGNLKFGSKPGDKVVDFGAGKSSDGTGEGVPGEVSHLPSVLGFGVWRFIDDKLGRKKVSHGAPLSQEAGSFGVGTGLAGIVPWLIASGSALPRWGVK